ncbi:MAG: hypothetical protein NC299_11765 [Lachnospiraceae bacterium]|nr:hypothetical protein [Lachnospiraceae bacterium]
MKTTKYFAMNALTMLMLVLAVGGVMAARRCRLEDYRQAAQPIIVEISTETPQISILETSEGSYTPTVEKSLTSEISGVLVDDSSEVPTADAPNERYALSGDERREIERMVSSEGGYCPYEFQALVAECILNGCEAENMRPSELFARGDFWLTHNVEPTEVTKQAVSDVFDKGVMPTREKVRYYYNPNYCSSAAHESFRYVLTNCDCRFFADW